MEKRPPKRPKLWGYVLLAGVSVVALIVVLATVFNWGRFIGPVIIGVLAAGVVLLVAFWDAIDAWGNERNVETNPQDVYSEDIGRTVTAIADFSPASSSSTGKVSLGGETWDAVYEGEQPPSKGDKLVVAQRDGLKLVVKCQEPD